jgi:hypothetical protein
MITTHSLVLLTVRTFSFYYYLLLVHVLFFIWQWVIMDIACLNEFSFQLYLYTNEEGSLSTAKACQSWSEEFGVILQHCTTTQCTHKPSCVRTWVRTTRSRGARTRVRTTISIKRRARGARTQVRTMSSSKRGAGGARTRVRTRIGIKRGARGARTRVRTTWHRGE